MDLTTVRDYVYASGDSPGHDWAEGDAWLAGGTWLFSTPQPGVRRLVDLTKLGWDTIDTDDAGIHIGATCTVGELRAYEARDAWPASKLIADCCESFLASWKIWHSATVGGNIVMSLPAGPMTSLAVALGATYTILERGGTETKLPAVEFVTGNNGNVLGQGQLLRQIDLPAESLSRQYAFRRFTLTKLGRSTVLVIATLSPETNSFLLTVTAATDRPFTIQFVGIPGVTVLRDALNDSIPDGSYFADTNGSPAHRKHLTHQFAQQIRTELLTRADRIGGLT